MAQTTTDTKLISEVRLAVALDEKDNIEGVCAILISGNWMPLMAADEDRFAFVRGAAEMVAHGQNILVKIISLTTRTELEEFDGRVSDNLSGTERSNEDDAGTTGEEGAQELLEGEGFRQADDHA